MPVTNSTHKVDAHPQRNGRYYVRETHTLSYGPDVIVDYLAPLNADYAAIRDARVAKINERLAEQEYVALVADDAPASITLHHQTGAEFAARLRAEFQRSTKGDCARLAWWLAERVTSGQLTELQVRTAFGLTAPQWATLRDTKIIPLHDAWDTILSALGE